MCSSDLINLRQLVTVSKVLPCEGPGQNKTNIINKWNSVCLFFLPFFSDFTDYLYLVEIGLY